MKNKGLIATIVVMSAIIVALIVVLITMQMTSIFPIGAKETLVESSTEVETTTEVLPSTEPVIVIDDEPKTKTEIRTYTSHGDRISIEYPEITVLNDMSLKDKINETLYSNAISIVRLYPISTALQRLNITCEVKYINDDYITVLYEGRVIGDQAGGANTNLRGTSKITSNNVGKTTTTDPYLDGFIDPMTLVPNTTTADAPQTNVTPVEIFDNNNAIDQVARPDNVKTTDSGPKTAAPITPTSSRKSNIVSGNSANNSPAAVINNNNTSSDGVYQSGGNAPYSSSGSTNSSNAPVYGYTGTSVSASTVNHKIFYTNTIDLKTGKNVTLNDFVSDFEKLARYARSSKVEIVNIDDSIRSSVRSYINKTVLSTLTEQLENESDFKNSNMSKWPKHFSYKDEDGTIYFTIKLSSKLGNYAIIKYTE